MKLNTNNNTYTVLYSIFVVVVVAFLLAFVSSSLKSRSEANERNDTKKQILSALNVRNVQDSQVEELFSSHILSDAIVNSKGEMVKKGENKDKDGFYVALKKIDENQLPIYTAKVNQDTLYVVPMSGKGLWGSIWGYVALKSDFKTVYGSYFSHESETAGLGALIKEESFQKKFEGKTAVNDDLSQVLLKVVKFGHVEDTKSECDGISGATLTGNGLNDMIQEKLKLYLPYFKTLKK